MTEGAAIGYMIRAAKQARISDETIKTLEALMREQIDLHTEEEAQQSYYSFYRTDVFLSRGRLTLMCPRCGYDRMSPKAAQNVLSRHAHVFICSPCGEDELMRNSFGVPPSRLMNGPRQ